MRRKYIQKLTLPYHPLYKAEKVKMTEYIIKKDYENDCFTYYHYSQTIGLKLLNNNLSDNELLEYISDSLTHEHIHKILNELFNNIVSKLFDGIDYFFRNVSLHEKQIKYTNSFKLDSEKLESYQTFIKRKSFIDFLHYYGITQEDMIQANKRCSDRLYDSKIDLNQTNNITWKKLKKQNGVNI